MPESARMFVVTGGEVVRLTLTGGRAHEARTVLAVPAPRCVAVDPHDPDRVYVGTFDDGLYATADGGETWHESWEGIADRRVTSVEVSRSHRTAGISTVYAGTEPSNLYRCEDGGETWQVLPELRQVPSEPRWSFPPRPWTHHVSSIALHPADPESLAVGIELGGVIRTTNGGRTWIDHNPQAHSDAHQLFTHPLAPDRLYEAAGQGLAVSPDRGQSWRRLDGGLDRHYAWATAADPADPDLWYASVSRSPYAAHGNGDGQARLLRAGGDGWSAIDTWGDEPALRRMPYALATLPGQPGRLLVGLRGGSMLLTDDAGATWTRLEPAVSDVIALAAAPV
ncbi:MAG: WD40/YVTN/BNR-like repeat-containing protein [Solirubrobacteraceae bacterium]